MASEREVVAEIKERSQRLLAEQEEEWRRGWMGKRLEWWPVGQAAPKGGAVKIVSRRLGGVSGVVVEEGEGSRGLPKGSWVSVSWEELKEGPWLVRVPQR